jgi:hypothetical protein
MKNNDELPRSGILDYRSTEERLANSKLMKRLAKLGTRINCLMDIDDAYQDVVIPWIEELNIELGLEPISRSKYE